MRALTDASLSYRTVKTILAGGLDRLPLPTKRTESDFVYGHDARLQRDTQTLCTFDLNANAVRAVRTLRRGTLLKKRRTSSGLKMTRRPAESGASSASAELPRFLDIAAPLHRHGVQ